ncbi:helix-turn-helix domain-containing protein [Streptomyces yunnanensis]|uniref:Helix-turn-helix domain-containing protein n=1 Tax=Streptomyces yunnanensis TaxID=156453 RepID=A0A9X8MYZ4_9ACTN|nr:helix-turn-helix domain-containing protein [Streptomyces yunnanensis]SHM36416.1 Helix-turn-helix domain-containing protein [Streptomyces yunnanensis]
MPYASGNGSERIGQRIAAARKARGLTQLQLAQRIPCSKSLIAQVERGHKPATPSLTAGAARALAVRLEQLTGQPYEDPHRGRVRATVPDIQTSMLSWDLPEEDLPVRPFDALAADVARASELGRKARYATLGTMLPSLLDELSAACHCAGGTEREKLFGLLAEAYSGVTAIAYAVGLFDLRSQAMDRVQWAARESQDPLRVGRTQWQRATLFLQAAAYSRGMRLLDRVRHDLGEDIGRMDAPSLSVHGSVHLRSAMFAARGGNASTARAHLDAAADAARLLGRDANHYGLEFGPTNVAMHRLGVAVELHDGPEVGVLTRRTRLPAGVAPVRAGRWHMDAAKGWLDYGDREKAFAALQEARRVAPEQTRNHPQVRESVQALIRLERYGKQSLSCFATWLGIT